MSMSNSLEKEGKWDGTKMKFFKTCLSSVTKALHGCNNILVTEPPIKKEKSCSWLKS